MPARFLPLDGLRALSVLWLVAFHVVFNLGQFITPAEYLALTRDPRVALLAQGHFGVDVFFVVSGFLICCLLLEEAKSKGTIAVGAFYLRRAFRILPAYFFVLFVAL